MYEMLLIVFWSLFPLMWLYVAARIITRGIIRSILEMKEREANGKKEC